MFRTSNCSSSPGVLYRQLTVFQHAEIILKLFELSGYRLSSYSVFSVYNQQDATFFNLFISVRRSTCFRRLFRPSSGAQNCTYSVRYLSDKYLTLYVQFWAPDDGRKTRLKHVQSLTEINNSRKVASCWLYSENILAMHGPMNVKFIQRNRKYKSNLFKFFDVTKKTPNHDPKLLYISLHCGAFESVPWPSWTCLVETLLLVRVRLLPSAPRSLTSVLPPARLATKFKLSKIWRTTPPHNEVNYKLHSSIYLS